MFDFAESLQLALDDGGNTHTLRDIADAIEANTMQFWYRGESAMVTQIEHTPRHTILHIALAGGTLEELEAMLPAVLSWGRESQQCTLARMDGRRGWSRLPQLAGFGWTVRGVTMTGPLTSSST